MKSVVAALLIPVFLISLLAHHSVTREFDHTRSTDIQGVITKVDWMNPHSRITFEAKGANGMRTRWRVQIAAAGALFRDGIRNEDLELTKPFSMEIWPARDGSKTAYGRKRTYFDGKSFDLHDRFFDPVPLIKPAK
jgi:hypothetical protein